MLRGGQLHLLLPQIILAAGAVIVMLSLAVKRSHSFAHKWTLLTLLVAFLSVFYKRQPGGRLTPLFIIDGFGSFFILLLVASVFFIVVISFPYLKGRRVQREEYYILMLLATLGSTAMVISNNFISFFLSLELLSVSLYGLIAYLKHRPAGIEAGIKYLIMAAVSSAILLFGIALIYARTGQLELSSLAGTGATGSVLFTGGLALVIAGIGFKLALVPFHLWTPDIYAGAPAPVSAFVATVSKGSVFAFLVRLFADTEAAAHREVWIAFAVLAVASMLIGNWLALRQQNVKRLLAYSSIANLGYLMVALLSASAAGVRAAAFFLVAYFISMLSAFGIITHLSAREDREFFDLEHYRGLFWEKPWVAALFTAVLLSLAGIPLSAGFMGKFYILLSGVGSALWVLSIVLVVSSAIGLFYYLRVIVVLFSPRPEIPRPVAGSGSVATAIALVVLFILLFWVGIFPEALLRSVHELVSLAPRTMQVAMP
jgi:NADH-quinone oxidoreductase subunit N